MGVGWFPFAILIAAIVLAALAVVLRWNMPSPLTVTIVRVMAAIYAGGAVIGTIASVARTITSTSVDVVMPVTPFWPTLPPGAGVEGTTATVVAGGFSQAAVTVDGLDGASRAWLVGEQVFQGATNVVVGVVIFVLCSSILKQDPFRSTLARGITVSAITIMVGGIGWQLCGSIGGWLASEQVLRTTGGHWKDTITWPDFDAILGMPQPGGNSWSIDFWPIGAGLALLALGAVFRFGRVIQKDTEGLV